MKIYALVKLKDGVIVNSAYDYDDIPFWYRSSTKNVAEETIRILASRVTENVRIDDSNMPGLIYLQKDSDFVYALACDRKYPSAQAHDILYKMRREDDFKKLIGESINYNTIAKVQIKTEEVKEIMVKNIETVLQRGENLDNLLEQSARLSEQSKGFYRESKKLNRCCSIL